MRVVNGPNGLPGITVTQPIAILTHKVGDPRWRGPKGTSLKVRMHLSAARTVRLVLHEKEFTLGWTQYARDLRLTPADGWQTVALTAGDFTTDKGEKLTGWSEVKMLELNSKGGPGAEPIFGEFRWIGAE